MSGGVRPAAGWRLLRRAAQALAIIAILVAPFLGGWQRLERNDLSSWLSPQTELPTALREQLPRGEPAGDAYRSNRLIGGGLAVDYFDIPTIDPLAGALTLMTGVPTVKALIALAIPVLLAIVVGRVFCGWFCPFGTLSRTMAWLLDFIPWTPRYRIPKRRPVRFLVLGVGMLAGLFGANVVLYLALPHLLVQQTVYSAWLLGGGGAALGLLVGLLLAGAVMGPTTYCATICPTGAALRLLGHKKVVHLQIAEPKDCGKTCRRCSLSCWLSLDAASGDPGPDCDLCGRCVPQCPKTNLRIGLGKGGLKSGASILIAALALGGASDAAAQAHSDRGRAQLQPVLTMAAERVVDGVTIAVDVVDQTGVRLAADSDETLSGSDVSVFLARGERDEPVDRGMPQTRDAYSGPLTVHIERRGEIRTLEYDTANTPRSTPRRAIYRTRVDLQLSPGDAVTIAPVEGWFAEPQRFEVPNAGVDASLTNTLLFALLGVLLFLGLLGLALAVRDPEEAPRESHA